MHALLSMALSVAHAHQPSYGGDWSTSDGAFQVDDHTDTRVQKLFLTMGIKADSRKPPCCSSFNLLQSSLHILRGRLDAGLAIMARVHPNQDAREPDPLHGPAIFLRLKRVLDGLWVEHPHQKVRCFGTGSGEIA